MVVDEYTCICVPPTWAGMYIHKHVYLLHGLVRYLIMCDEVFGIIDVVSKL